MEVRVSRYIDGDDSLLNEAIGEYDDVATIMTGPDSDGIAWFGEFADGTFDLAICEGFEVCQDGPFLMVEAEEDELGHGSAL